MDDLKDKFAGERIFVIGNGPSLNETPLEKLQSEFTFAMKEIHKIYPETNWRPDFWYGHPNNHSNENEECGACIHLDMGTMCFMKNNYSDSHMGNNAFFYEKRELLGTDCPLNNFDLDGLWEADIDTLYDYWSEDMSKYIYTYHSMYAVLQIIDYMGFDEIYIVGADLGMEYVNPHMIFDEALDPYRFGWPNGDTFRFIKKSMSEGVFIKSVINGIAMKSIENDTFNKVIYKYLNQADNHHFDEDYTEYLRIWDGERRSYEIQKSHVVAKKILEDKNIKICNATIGGELEVYPRCSFGNILE